MKIAAALLLSIALHAADLVIAAASDLAPLSTRLTQEFERASGDKARFTFASSGSLATQIENGAPFDIFLSASEEYVNNLAASGYVDRSTVTVYATGRIALWSRDGSVRSFEDLKTPQVKHLAIANPEHAPYGIAAKKALESRGVWKSIQPKIVYGENVRQALQFAESGNADAVITSWTLLIGRGILLPAEWHPPIRQAGGIVKSSAQAPAANRFLKFLLSPQGRKTLQEGGLFPPA
jgi:molybdate transport system substrate-binding protein